MTSDWISHPFVCNYLHPFNGNKSTICISSLLHVKLLPLGLNSCLCFVAAVVQKSKELTQKLHPWLHYIWLRPIVLMQVITGAKVCTHNKSTPPRHNPVSVAEPLNVTDGLFSSDVLSMQLAVCCVCWWQNIYRQAVRDLWPQRHNTDFCFWWLLEDDLFENTSHWKVSHNKLEAMSFKSTWSIISTPENKWH